MDNTINVVLLEKLCHTLIVADISLYECIIRLILNIFEIGQIARIGQLVKVNDMIFGILLYKKTYYVAADKTCTACDKYIFSLYIYA